MQSRNSAVETEAGIACGPLSPSHLAAVLGREIAAPALLSPDRRVAEMQRMLKSACRDAGATERRASETREPKRFPPLRPPHWPSRLRPWSWAQLPAGKRSKHSKHQLPARHACKPRQPRQPRQPRKPRKQHQLRNRSNHCTHALNSLCLRMRVLAGRAKRARLRYDLHLALLSYPPQPSHGAEGAPLQVRMRMVLVSAIHASAGSNVDAAKEAWLLDFAPSKFSSTDKAC